MVVPVLLVAVIAQPAFRGPLPESAYGSACAPLSPVHHWRRSIDSYRWIFANHEEGPCTVLHRVHAERLLGQQPTATSRVTLAGR
jgi:hypothetical protein